MQDVILLTESGPLQKILYFCSFTDLLRLQLVCKKWKSVCLKILEPVIKTRDRIMQSNLKDWVYYGDESHTPVARNKNLQNIKKYLKVSCNVAPLFLQI